MESHRILLHRVDVDGVQVACDYADVFVVVRPGEDGPGRTDWEVRLRTELPRRMVRARPGWRNWQTQRA